MGIIICDFLNICILRCNLVTELNSSTYSAGHALFRTGCSGGKCFITDYHCGYSCTVFLICRYEIEV